MKALSKGKYFTLEFNNLNNPHKNGNYHNIKRSLLFYAFPTQGKENGW